MRKKISILILVSSFISSITFSTVRSETDTTSILVLNSYHHGYQWTDDVLEGFLSQFPENDPSLDIRIEYMDTKHFNTPDYFELLKKVYHSKYKDKKINLIVVTDNAALDFIKRHRRELFPDIPVVFCGINQFSPSLITGMNDITGVVEDHDIKQTLNLALSLYPDTKTIAVVCDSSIIGESDLLRFRKVEDEYSGTYNILEITAWTEPELIEALENLPEKTIVLRLSFQNMNNSINFDDKKAKEIWDKYCKFPTYTSLGHKVKSGVLGGVLNIGKLHGELVAEFSHRISDGTKADSISIVHVGPKRPVFDYLMMQRFEIDESNLPPDAILINKSFSLYNLIRPLQNRRYSE